MIFGGIMRGQAMSTIDQSRSGLQTPLGNSTTYWIWWTMQFVTLWVEIVQAVDQFHVLFLSFPGSVLSWDWDWTSWTSESLFKNNKTFSYPLILIQQNCRFWFQPLKYTDHLWFMQIRPLIPSPHPFLMLTKIPLLSYVRGLSNQKLILLKYSYSWTKTLWHVTPKGCNKQWY